MAQWESANTSHWSTTKKQIHLGMFKWLIKLLKFHNLIRVLPLKPISLTINWILLIQDSLLNISAIDVDIGDEGSMSMVGKHTDHINIWLLFIFRYSCSKSKARLITCNSPNLLMKNTKTFSTFCYSCLHHGIRVNLLFPTNNICKPLKWGGKLPNNQSNAINQLVNQCTLGLPNCLGSSKFASYNLF